MEHLEGLTLAAPEFQPDRNQSPIPLLLITVKQAADALQLSERTIFNLIDNRKLPSVTFGGSRRIDIEDVRKLAKTGAELPTLAEREQKQKAKK